VTAGAGTVSFTWNAMVGLSYQVQYKTNLTQPAWSDLGAPLVATNNTPSASDTTGPDPQRFYRLSVSP
jgi:hypothetical protein